MNYWIRSARVPVETATGEYGTPCQYETVDVGIADRHIAAIQPASSQAPPAGSTVIDAADRLLLPGWVNAHTHSMEMWTRGLIPPLPLELWLAELYTHPIQEVEQIYLAALLTAVETLTSGGTTVVDHLVLIPGHEIESLAAADRAYRATGIRAYIAPLLQDEPFEYSLPGGRTLEPSAAMLTTDVLALMEEIVQTFHHPEEGMQIAIAPTGIQLCSDDLFQGCAALSDRHNLCRHGHLLETLAQVKLAREKLGRSAVEHLADLSWLGPTTSMAHCVWLSDRDIELMAETGTTAIHNPLSNLRLGSGIAPLLKLRERGVNVSFGCDGAASNDGQSLFEVLKIGSMLHNITDFDYRHWISPQQVCQMASAGGARGLNCDRFGQLAVGQEADLVLYRPDDLSLLPATDPLGQLIWGRPGDVVDSVWVRGRRILRNGRVLGVDRTELMQKLRSYDGWLGVPDRDSTRRDRLEKLYRSAMDLPN
ncbi:amidohydrolase [Synechococcus sp. PCC 7336]|uniref:amidohydrolase n=1 Tax=Synechococcus sp. PCC 7336 TaxID=195250 RepID=UPI00034A4BB6|nr:amidohydrolase [Synechococcus sp. PCC 7336]